MLDFKIGKQKFNYFSHSKTFFDIDLTELGMYLHCTHFINVN
jgi:hypothetical protein